MKLALVVFALLLGQASAFAGETQVLLDCKISFGPNQNVRVLKTTDGLILEELTDTGTFKRRALSQEELASNELRLRVDSPFDGGTLTLTEEGRWFYDFSNSKGYAYCK